MAPNEKVTFHEIYEITLNKTRQSHVFQKADNERINIRSFSTWRFGLRSHGRLIYSKILVLSTFQNHEKHDFWHEWGRTSTFYHFEMGNLHEIESSSYLDYSRAIFILFFIMFTWFYWFSRVSGPKTPQNHMNCLCTIFAYCA